MRWSHSLRRKALARRSWLALCLVALAVAVAALLSGAALAPAAPSGSALVLRPNHFAKPPHGTSSSSFPGWTSSNWSGYAVTGSSYNAITAEWKVPAVSSSKTASYSAAWAGIDGFNNDSLIQTGTEQDYYNHSAHYAAWWTTSAQGFVEQPINNHTVSPGDFMTATISGQTPSTSDPTPSWTITLSDQTIKNTTWTFATTVQYSGPCASAEWIMEAPTIGGRIAPLAAYASPVTFDPGTVNDVSPGLTPQDGGEMVVHARHGLQVISIPSLPDSDLDGFNVNFGSAIPSAPRS